MLILIDTETLAVRKLLEGARYYEAIFGFLDKHVPVSPPPRASGPAPAVASP